MVQRHYHKVNRGVRSLDEILMDLHVEDQVPNTEPPDPENMTAVLLVSRYSGFGLHTFLSIFRNYPAVYKNFVFISVGEIDSGSFKGVAELGSLQQSVEDNLDKYVQLAKRLGFSSTSRMALGIDVVDTATQLCEDVAKEFPKSTIFAGKLIFKKESIFHRLLHNETAFAIQRRLQWAGIAMMILPIRVIL
jgi:hypothetical protein